MQLRRLYIDLNVIHGMTGVQAVFDDYPGTELQNGLKNTWEIINTKTTKTWTDLSLIHI